MKSVSFDYMIIHKLNCILAQNRNCIEPFDFVWVVRVRWQSKVVWLSLNVMFHMRCLNVCVRYLISVYTECLCVYIDLYVYRNWNDLCVWEYERAACACLYALCVKIMKEIIRYWHHNIDIAPCIYFYPHRFVFGVVVVMRTIWRFMICHRETENIIRYSFTIWIKKTVETSYDTYFVIKTPQHISLCGTKMCNFDVYSCNKLFKVRVYATPHAFFSLIQLFTIYDVD